MPHSHSPKLRAALRTRLALREAFGAFDEGSLVLVGLSGGADSLALAAAAAHERKVAKLRVGAVIIDHGLQPGSAEVAERAAQQARGFGFDPVVVRRVRVEAHPGGPEAAAREARYVAFAEIAAHSEAAAILLAHTRDDQAEQVLLALARGSGMRSLAGIPPEREISGVRVVRPFLQEGPCVTRETTEAACSELGLDPWIDPHNSDPAFARVRVRARVLPVLEAELGPGISAALARTADLAREDAEALDELAAEAAARARTALTESGEVSSRRVVEIPIEAIDHLPVALRNRAIRKIAAGRLGVSLTRDRTRAIAALVTRWRGQGPIHAPGIRVSRRDGLLIFEQA